MTKLRESIALMFRRTSDDQRQAGIQFIVAARDEMMAQHKRHAATWPHGKETGWSADLGAGMIVFKFRNEQSGTSQFQTIGIYDETEGTFHWGWAHPSVPPALRAHAILAKKWGRLHQQSAYTSKIVTCTLEEAWDFAAVTSKLAVANGVYRGHAGNKYIFMTTGEIHLNTESEKQHWAAIARLK